MKGENFYNPEELIEERRISLPNGLDGIPGELVKLDTDELLIDGETCNITLYAWFDKKWVFKERKCSNNFIVKYKHNILILDYYFEAAETYRYLIDKYPY